MRDTSDLEALLSNAVPAPPPPEEEERIFSEVWSRLQARMGEGEVATAGDPGQQQRPNPIAERQAPARRRRGAAKLASLTLAVAVIGSGTAAAAAFLSTRTGQRHSGWEVEAGGSGEILNMGGTDRTQVFDEVTADIPFAPGYETQRAWALEFFPRETESAISEEFLRSWMVGNAVCTWADAWVAADNIGDGAARQAATTVLGEAVSWRDIVQSDFPDAVISESGEHLSNRWWVGPLANAARAGDRRAVLNMVAHSTACSHHVLPFIDAAPDYAHAGVR